MAGANAIAGPAGRPTPVPDQRPAPSPAGRAARGHGPWPAGPGVRACRGGAHPGPPARSPTPSPTANRTGWCATPATLSRSPPTRQPGCGRWRSAMCWLLATRLAPDRLGLQAIHVRPAVGHPALPRLLSMVWGPAHAHDRMAAMSAEDYRPAGAIAPGWRGHGGRLLMVISTGCRCPVRPPPRAGWPGAAPPLGSGTGFAGQRRS
jgi:hypothetical protein